MKSKFCKGIKAIDTPALSGLKLNGDYVKEQWRWL